MAEPRTLEPPVDTAAATLGSPRPGPRRAVWAGAVGAGLALLLTGVALGTVVLRPGAGPAASPLFAAGATSSAATTQTIVPADTQATESPTETPTDTPTDTPTETPTDTPTETPTDTPTDTPADTPAEVPAGLTILSPADGSTVDSREVTVTGTAPPNSDITHDIGFWPDQHARAGGDGNWQMQVGLTFGQNVLTFRLGQDRSTDVQITVYYEP